MSKSRYLLGEMVPLRVEVVNDSKEEVESLHVFVDEDLVDSEIAVLFSHDQEPFEYYNARFYPSEPERAEEVLAPGESRVYRVNVLYMRDKPHHLAFHQPGQYQIRVRYPLFQADYTKRTPVFESNTIAIRIEEPRGTDAKVWQTLKKPQHIHFLHGGRHKPDHSETIQNMISLFQTYPGSDYASAIRYALVRYYESTQSYKNLKQREQLRGVLGIEADVLFPEDRRLDSEFPYTLKERTPFPGLIQILSKLGGVPLEVSPAIRGGIFEKGTSFPASLRTHMQRYGRRRGTYWERRGEGYYLSELPFPFERRLGQTLLIYYPQPAPIGEVLRSVSKRSSLSLKASPSLSNRKMQLTAEIYVPTLLLRLAEMTDAIWVRRSEGYYLTREPEKLEPDG